MKREKAKESLLQIYGFALKNQVHLTFKLEAKSSEGSQWSTSRVTCLLFKNIFKTSLFPEDKLSHVHYKTVL